MSTDIETLREQYDELLEVLGSLVHKIEAEEAFGTPLHPKGHPDCCWLKNDGYPTEYDIARQVLAGALAREKSKWGHR